MHPLGPAATPAACYLQFTFHSVPRCQACPDMTDEFSEDRQAWQPWLILHFFEVCFSVQVRVYLSRVA